MEQDGTREHNYCRSIHAADFKLRRSVAPTAVHNAVAMEVSKG
jgi:hypothetical protein